MGIIGSDLLSGDIAALLASGWSVKKVALVNFISACTALLGLYIGIPIATALDAQSWILGAAMGIFLYVGLANIVSFITKLVATFSFHKTCFTRKLSLSNEQILCSLLQINKTDFLSAEIKDVHLKHWVTLKSKCVGSITSRVSVHVVITAMTLVIQLSLKSMETYIVTPEWGCNPFWSDFILFNGSYVITAV